MPRLKLIGVDDYTLGKLKGLTVPVVLTETLLTRDPEGLAKELGVSLRRIQKLRYQVARRCVQGALRGSLSHEPRGVAGGRGGVSRDGGDDDSNDHGDRMTSGPGGGGGEGGGRARGGSYNAKGAGQDGGQTDLPSFSSAATMYRMMLHQGMSLSTGSARVDAVLQPGLLAHQVVEVVGSSNVGKTQICITAAIETALRGWDVIYIDSSNSASSQRMRQIAVQRCQRHRQHDDNSLSNAAVVEAALARIRIVPAFDVMTLLGVLEQCQSDLETASSYMSNHAGAGTAEGNDEDDDNSIVSSVLMHTIAESTLSSSSSAAVTTTSTTAAAASELWHTRLVIVDCITAVLASEIGGKDNHAGHAVLTSVGDVINSLAYRCSVSVVVTNGTVTDPQSGASAVKPAMGKTWSYVASTRILLSKVDRDNPESSVRRVVLLKHPAQACGKSDNFYITKEGIADSMTPVT